MLEQPPSQADMCRELIKPPIVSHFQDTFLAGSLAVAHLTWDQPKARRAADSPFDAGTGSAFHSRSSQPPLAVKLLVFMTGENALDSCCSYLMCQNISQINNSQFVICLWLISRALTWLLLTILSSVF